MITHHARDDDLGSPCLPPDLARWMRIGSSHTPEIIFLVRMVFGTGVGGQTGGAEIRGQHNWKQSAALGVRGGGYRPLGFDASWRNAMGLTIGLVDQAEQVVIVNVLDVVGEDHEFAIDLI